MNKNKMFWFNTTSQLLIGLTFIASGFLKAIDIYGTELKLIEYANNLDFNFLREYNVFLSVILCSFEIFLGLWLVTFVYKRLSLIVLIATMLFFSGIIIYFKINPEKEIIDCGCFGEILPTEMTKSLIKNIVILLFGCCLLWSERTKETFFHIGPIVIILICIISSLPLPLYTAEKLSLYNPTEYRIGINLNEKENFILLNDDFENVKDSLLGKTEKVYIFILKKSPNRLEGNNIKMISQICVKEDASCFALSTNKYELIDEVTQYFTDKATLNSLVRSRDNGFVTLINGIIDNVMILNDY